MAAEVRAPMNGENWTGFLAGFDPDEEDETDDREERFVERLGSDPFAFLDQLVAEKQNVPGGADEVRRGYWRGRRRR
jgi:hypothetical protein